MKYYYIYKIKDKLTNKVYIGQHISNKKDDKYMGSGVLITNKIKKYGKQNFIKEILEYCNDNQEILNEKETYYIKKFNTIYPNGYNLTLGGDGNSGWNMAEKTKEKIRNSLIGFKVSKKTRKKLSEIRRGRKFTKEHKRNLSEAHKKLDYSYRIGQKHSEETKKKISEFNKGKEFTEEHKRNLSEAHKGKILTKEHKDKISKSLLNKYIK